MDKLALEVFFTRQNFAWNNNRLIFAGLFQTAKQSQTLFGI